MADQIRNMRPDPPDFRDRFYNPILSPLEPEFNAQPHEHPAWTARVKHQGDTSACTGFALSTMVEVLAFKRWEERQGQDEPPGTFSPYMLYYFARRYDEFKNDDEDGGSTARAGMKAWHKHGVCRIAHWKELRKKPSTADQEWVNDAFQTPLGSYYRVNHQSIPDLHAAINETGVVYVTAETHDGWSKPNEKGWIVYRRGLPPAGGHAFLLVGYNENGFWIQNSWGPGWGQKGFAHLSYTDWAENGWDAWVGQLGVYISSHSEDLSHGLQYDLAQRYRRETKSLTASQKNAIVASRAMLSGNEVVRAQQINPYIVNLQNNGRLSDDGKFRTTTRDLDDMADFYLPEAVRDWKLKADDPIDVALYAHGGLVAESDAAEAAALWIPTLYASRIFPVFFMWETGLLDTLGNIFREMFGAERRAERLAGGLKDRLLNFFDDRLEGIAALPGTPIWEEIKENAERATSNPQGGLRLLARAMNKLPQDLTARLRFHLIGHSAGAIFHAHLLPALIDGGLRVQGVYLMAPACRVDLFREKILPAYQSGKIEHFAQFHMRDDFEQDDACLGVYNRSLLYLVSNAFERMRGRPILGMEKFVDQSLRKKPASKKVQTWDFIASPTPVNSPASRRSHATTHGGFDNDEPTILSILARIKGA